MTNEELVAEIQAGNNVQANMAELYQQNRPLLDEIAFPFSGFCEMDDLLQEAYFGLERAVQGYDPGRGFKFMTYAENWIRVSIQRYCQNNGRLKRMPVHVLERISKYHKFRSDILAATGEEPDDQAYMNHLEISKKGLSNLRKYMDADTLISIDSPLPGTDDLVLGDAIPDDFDLEETVVDAIARQEAKTAVWDAVSNLPGRCPEIIESGFKRDEPYHMTADRLAVSVERVRVLREKALKLLRGNRKIQVAAQIYDYGTDQLYHWGVGRFKQTNTSSVEYIALKQVALEESRKRIVDQGRDIQTTVPVIADKMREQQAGFTPVGVRRLEELNAQIEQMVQEYQEYKEKQKKAKSNKQTTKHP